MEVGATNGLLVKAVVAGGSQAGHGVHCERLAGGAKVVAVVHLREGSDVDSLETLDEGII